jgi:hypothetical protein
LIIQPEFVKIGANEYSFSDTYIELTQITFEVSQSNLLAVPTGSLTTTESTIQVEYVF